MDSGNSGSMQSSSGNDEQDFDTSSRSSHNNLTSFLNNPSPQNYPFPNTNFFDPQTFSQTNPNFVTNNINTNDLIWSRTLRSDHPQPNYANFGNHNSLSGTTSHSTIPSTQGHHQVPYPTPSSTVHPPSRPSGPSDNLSNVIKNPKKRTRASRRAPTTVLTTDTTNFRQMVQEFTGIPASPFSNSPYSRRPDIFSGLRPNMHLDSLGPLYPLRPSASKIFSSFPSSSPSPSMLNPTMIDSIVPTTNIVSNNNNSNTVTTTTVGASGSNNYQQHQMSSDHLMNLQQQHNQGMNARMNFGNLLMSGAFSEVRNNNNSSSNNNDGHDDDDHNVTTTTTTTTTRWRSSSGETSSTTEPRNSNNNNDGIGENMMNTFDHHHDTQQQHVVSGTAGGGISSSYNLNISSDHQKKC